MILYILLLSLALFTSFVASKTEKRFFLYLTIGLLTIIAGFRGVDVGIDTPSYYSNIISGFPYHWKFREEGFRFISNIVIDMTSNPQLVFILCALVTNILIVCRLWDFRKNSSFTLAMLIYLLVYYSNTLNIMRQYVAVAIVFYASRYLFKKRYIIFLVFLFIASLFHRSALLGIIMLIIDVWGTLSNKRKRILFVPTIIVILSICIYVYVYFKADLNSYGAQRVYNINIPFLYHLVIFLFAWITNKNRIFSRINKLNDSYSYNTLIDIRIPLYALIGLFFESLGMFFAFVDRTGLYFIFYEIVFWAYLGKKSKNSYLFNLIFLIYAFYVFSQVFTRNSYGLFPYSLFVY